MARMKWSWTIICLICLWTSSQGTPNLLRHTERYTILWTCNICEPCVVGRQSKPALDKPEPCWRCSVRFQFMVPYKCLDVLVGLSFHDIWVVPLASYTEKSLTVSACEYKSLHGKFLSGSLIGRVNNNSHNAISNSKSQKSALWDFH